MLSPETEGWAGLDQGEGKIAITKPPSSPADQRCPWQSHLTKKGKRFHLLSPRHRWTAAMDNDVCFSFHPL